MKWTPMVLAVYFLIFGAIISMEVQGNSCSNPIVVNSLPYSYTGSTTLAGNNEQSSCGGGAPEVVFSYTPSSTMTVDFTTCAAATNYDTVIFVREAVCTSIANEIACNDDYTCIFNGLRSTVNNVQLTAGTTYYFFVDGFSANSGNFEMFISQSGSPPSSAPPSSNPPPPSECSVSFVCGEPQGFCDTNCFCQTVQGALQCVDVMMCGDNCLTNSDCTGGEVCVLNSENCCSGSTGTCTPPCGLPPPPPSSAPPPSSNPPPPGECSVSFVCGQPQGFCDASCLCQTVEGSLQCVEIMSCGADCVTNSDCTGGDVCVPNSENCCGGSTGTCTPLCALPPPPSSAPPSSAPPPPPSSNPPPPGECTVSFVCGEPQGFCDPSCICQTVEGSLECIQIGSCGADCQTNSDCPGGYLCVPNSENCCGGSTGTCTLPCGLPPPPSSNPPPASSAPPPPPSSNPPPAGECSVSFVCGEPQGYCATDCLCQTVEGALQCVDIAACGADCQTNSDCTGGYLCVPNSENCCPGLTGTCTPPCSTPPPSSNPPSSSPPPSSEPPPNLGYTFKIGKSGTTYFRFRRVSVADFTDESFLEEMKRVYDSSGSFNTPSSLTVSAGGGDPFTGGSCCIASQEGPMQWNEEYIVPFDSNSGVEKCQETYSYSSLSVGLVGGSRMTVIPSITVTAVASEECTGDTLALFVDRASTLIPSLFFVLVVTVVALFLPVA